MHVLVASGSNIAFVVGLWYLLMRILFRVPRRPALVSSLPAAWSYAFLAGLDAPILRAAMMTSVALTAHALSRDDRPIHSFGVAVLAMLLLEPRLVSDLGFRMSFLTVAGLLLTLPGLGRALLPTQWPLRRTLLQLMSTSLVAEAWLLPVTVAIFKRIYPLSLFANTLVVPLSGGGLFAGFGLYAADQLARFNPVLEGFAQTVSVAVSLYVRFLYSLARLFADHPGHVMWTRSPNAIVVTGYYLTLISLLRIRDLMGAKIGLAVGLAMMGLGFATEPPPPHPTAFQATWLDAGRGLAVLVQTPSTKNGLVLSSPVPPVETWEKILMPYFAERRVHRLNYVVSPSSYSVEDRRRIDHWISIDRWINSEIPQTAVNGDLQLDTFARPTLTPTIRP